MEYNPYQSPYSSPDSWNVDEHAARDRAQAALRGPAIALMITAGLWILLLLAAIAFDGWLLGSGAVDGIGNARQVVDRRFQVIVRMVGCVVLIVAQGLIVAGSVGMLRLKSYALAKTAAVLAIVPCCSACYSIGIPFGIWALVVLNRSDVRDAFT